MRTPGIHGTPATTSELPMTQVHGPANDSNPVEAGTDLPLVRGRFSRLELIRRPSRVPYILSALLGAAAATAAGLTLAYPDVLTGVAGANGNMLGTAAVALVVGVPVLATSMVGAWRGSSRASVVWLGALAYLLYQAVLFCFATPLNNFFLFYVAYLSLAIWGIVFLLRSTDLTAFSERLAPAAPNRLMAGYALLLVALNSLAWLSGIIPAVFSDHPGASLQATGQLTNPIWIQDLAVWLPLLAVAAVAAWRRQAWGQLITAAMLAMFVLESISIAVDQWFGSVADPGSSGSAMVFVPAFAAVAVLTAVPLVAFLRQLDRAPQVA